MTRRRSVILGVLVVGFGGATMTGACVTGELGGPEPGPVGSCATPPDTPPETPTDTPTDCSAPPAKPCMLYHIPLVGNPSFDVPLRNKYIAAFGSACYMSVSNTFDCFYEKWQNACADAKKIGKVAGVAPYNENYNCESDGVGNYTLQIGPDVANKIYINYQAAPLESSFINVDGMPTAINGPYRNLPQLTTIKPGEDFDCKTGIPGPDGGTLSQRDWFIRVNQSANGGKIRSDMAGFRHPCKTGCPEICTEPEFLNDVRYGPLEAQVNHVVRKTDLRGCKWGSNANSNAMVISGKLNRYLKNKYPLKDEVDWVNTAPPYTYTP